MKLLLQYLKPYKWLVALALLLAAINQTFSLFDPMIFGKLIDQYGMHVKIAADGTTRTESQYINGIMFMLLLLVGTAMVSRIAKAFQDYVVNVIIQKFGARIFTDGLKHSMRLPYQEFEDQRSGETLSILTKVRADTEKFIGYVINVLFSIIVSVIFVSIYATRLHWSIIPIYLGGALLIAFVTNLLSKKIKTIQKKIVKETTSLAGSTTESLRNIELVKSLGLTNQEVSRLNTNTYKILGLELKKVKSIRSLSFIQGTMVNLLRQVITFTLMWLIFRQVLTVGQLISLQFYSFFIFGPLQEIGSIIMSYREAEASLINFHNLMEKEAEPKPAHPRHVGVVEELEFRDVVFKHQTAQYKALDGISFDAKKGETIAFVGPSGAGKSTLVKLLVGLYRPQGGHILYNGVNGLEINFDEMRNQIGFVTQDTQLFAGTIRENLLFVHPEASDADLAEALHKASCDNLLQRAEKGIDTMIGEGGLKLSGGEKQRLSIARALLRHPHLLIFDEATSALDSITEEEITNTIRSISLEKEQITVMIAHRLSTIMHAHRIYVLEKGQVVETGSHEQLLAEKGLYYAMWRQQIGERKIMSKEPALVN
ncbi:ATP-binding cassette, subfamily B [Hydrobacter penzbergensis]|jgi:ATP-binding cassette subfamily B protein|uniref:ATP-binding cassette, subfamily B n=1 Tax=Hydrobacter penzbergensis TaxID=1235997 RepID=A0A8X8LDT4_9BACT|nr:ABC transporter ATP-binding protein [Hydrobacter penzbergensis]MBN8719089.1 ABC transporter ATP-binding protein [Sediminibacterium magnilacihabitans]PQV60968.1 ATP-binding cassette subfamily B protein [Sediminibacterium magnilacihabitans]SDW95321.1 ATP-binding cassette, subfamily B [Hydrobacter penzbergensis]